MHLTSFRQTNRKTVNKRKREERAVTEVRRHCFRATSQVPTERVSPQHPQSIRKPWQLCKIKTVGSCVCRGVLLSRSLPAHTIDSFHAANCWVLTARHRHAVLSNYPDKQMALCQGTSDHFKEISAPLFWLTTARPLTGNFTVSLHPHQWVNVCTIALQIQSNTERIPMNL